MAVEIKVPSAGESIREGILARWLKPDGSVVKQGDLLYELETDKTMTEVPAESSGTLKISVAEGTTVAIGSVVGSIDTSAAPSASTSAPANSAVASGNSSTSKPQGVVAAPSASMNAVSDASLAPSVRRLVAENSLDPSKIEGTGRDGRLTKGDVLGKLAQAPAAAPTSVAPAAAPLNAAKTTPAAPASASAPAGRETRKRMSGLRQTIAARLVEAQQTAAILTTFNEADMSRIMELRTKYKDAYQKKHGVGLGFMSFFIKAVIEALKAYPAVNGRIDGTDMVYHNYYNIGVAVSTERGLMVPVLRDADTLTFSQIEKTIASFAVKAREGTISVNDLQGGTFTITNGGVFGSLLSTPILNPPQSGILGMHTIQKRPVAIDDQIVIRPMMYLAHSYDHRMVDGREAVGFLVRIKECVENPERLMLEV